MKKLLFILIILFSTSAFAQDMGDGKKGARVYTIATLPTCSATANNGQTVSVSDGNKGQRTCRNTTGSTYAWVDDDPRFDVRRFGAVLDGSTDDTAAFSATATAAVAAGGTLYIPPSASGLILDTVTLSGALIIEGDGKGISLIKRKASATNTEMIVTAYSLTIRKLTIDGTSATVTTRKSMVDFNPATVAGRNLIIEDVVFQNVFTPVYARAIAGNITINRSDFLEVAEGDGGVSYPNATLAIYVQSGTGNVTVDNCTFVTSYTPVNATYMPGGIEVYGTSAASPITSRIVNNYFKKMGSDNVSGAIGCVDLYDFGNDSAVNNNRFFDSYSSAIKVANTPRLSITNNIIRTSRSGVDSAAIYVNGAARSSTGVPFSNFTITGNTVTGWDNYGMQLQGASGAIPLRWTVQENTLDGNKRGVLFDYVGDVTFQGNTISNGTGPFANESSALYFLHSSGQSLRFIANKILDNPSYGLLADSSTNDTVVIELINNTFRSSSTDQVRWNSGTATGTMNAYDNRMEGTQRPFLLSLGGSGATLRLYNNRTESGATANSFSATNIYKANNDFDVLLYSASTTPRTVTIPDATTTLAGLGVTQTFTAPQTIAATLGITAGNANISGGTVTGRAANVTAAALGNSFYWGHTNTGFKSTIGAKSSAGTPNICFYCYHGSTANTFQRSSASNLPTRIEATTTGEIEFYTAPAGTVDADISDFTKRFSVTTTGATVASGSTFTIADTGTATASAGAATLNTQTGIITTEALTTAAGSTYALTITNSKVTTSSIVTASVQNGTNSVDNYYVQRITPGSGSVTIVIYNASGGALNGTIKVSFIVM